MELTFKVLGIKDKYPMVIPLKGRSSITNKLSEPAYVLYYYLHSKDVVCKWKDINVEKDLGWTTRKVETYTRKLKEAKLISGCPDKEDRYMYLKKNQDVSRGRELWNWSKKAKDNDEK